MNPKHRSQPTSEERTWFKRTFYTVLRLLARIIAILLLRMRCEGREHFPAQGGGLVLSTHQSNLDPVLVGLTCNRRFNFLARKTLFKNFLFAWLIRTLDAIEIDREGGGLSGLRETMARLKRQELVLIFPEGTRTRTGAIGDLKPGFLVVARRSAIPLIPVAVVGAYEILPRGKRWPSFHSVAVVIGKPISAAEVAALDDNAVMTRLSDALHSLDKRGRQLIGLDR